MVHKKRNVVPIRIRNGAYHPVEEEVHISQLVRVHPSLDKLKGNPLKQAEKYAEEYISFLNKIRIAPDAVKEARAMTEESRDYSSRRENFHFIEDEDKSAFALVRFGRRPVKEGLRFLLTHCDSPCLQAKVKPLAFEWDIDKRDLHLGVEIDTHEYGGIHPHQWTGRRLEVCGWTVINGRRREIRFPVYSPEVAVHTDDRNEHQTDFEEAHKREELDLVPGDTSRKEILKRLRFQGEEDFARARLYAVPAVKAERLHDYYITGYGQDNRIGIFSSLKALLDKNPKYTSILFGFDKEEVGSGGLAGAKGRFFDDVILEVLEKSGIKARDITDSLKRDIYKNSIAINADVDVGSTHREVDVVDARNVAKLGYGIFVCADDGRGDSDQQSPYLLDVVFRNFERNGVVLQTIGCPLSADRFPVPSFNEFFDVKGIRIVNCGISIGSLHSPEEISHVGDLYQAIKAYKSFLQEPASRK